MNNLSLMCSSVERSPTTSSDRPYIGELSTTEPPFSNNVFNTSFRGLRSAADSETSKVCHVPRPITGNFSPVDDMVRFKMESCEVIQRSSTDKIPIALRCSKHSRRFMVLLFVLKKKSCPSDSFFFTTVLRAWRYAVRGPAGVYES